MFFVGVFETLVDSGREILLRVGVDEGSEWSAVECRRGVFGVVSEPDLTSHPLLTIAFTAGESARIYLAVSLVLVDNKVVFGSSCAKPSSDRRGALFTVWSGLHRTAETNKWCAHCGRGEK